jgi:pyridoxine 5-phosphate synthase
VATVRQARRAPEPSVVAAALMCEEAGADGMTTWRPSTCAATDRRHIQDEDIYNLRRVVTTYLNVEMAATDEMVQIATDARPDAVSLVAEKPGEITTEGGLDTAANFDTVRRAIDALRDGGLFVSIFIDPDPRQIEAAHNAGAQQVELCTAALRRGDARRARDSLRGARARRRRASATARGRHARRAVRPARRRRTRAHLPQRRRGRGHPEITEFNIGHNVIARAVLTGLSEAVREMRARIREAKA